MPDLSDPSEILSAVLDRIARRPPLLLALDFDGTLAPLRDNPEQSRMLPEAARALAALAAHPEHIRVALVSGRALNDLHRLADPPTGTVLIGSHGAERAQVAAHGLDRQDIRLDERQSDRLTTLGSRMQAVARGREGVWVETKPAAVVVHTRLAESSVRAEAEAQALTIGQELGSAVLHGKNVVEVSVLTADKGAAVSALRTELGAGAVLYAGDDVTDEDAFTVLTEDDLGVKVGDGRTRARYRLADPDAVAAVLQQIAAHLPAAD